MPHLLAILRHNITLESDVDLAKAELTAICHRPSDAVRPFASVKDLRQWLTLASSAVDNSILRFALRKHRKDGTIAFAVQDVNIEAFLDVINRAAFVQEVIILNADPAREKFLSSHRLTRCRRALDNQLTAFGIPIATMLEYSAPLVFKRDKISNLTVTLDALAELLLDNSPPPNGLSKHLLDALDAKKTTLYLSHELHLYKGKFFPRLVHGLINRFAPANGSSFICDPFAGSGTALLESSILGYRSVGIDIDPTSVLISQNKMALAYASSDELGEVCAAIQTAIEDKPSSMFFAGRTYDISCWTSFLVAAPEPMRSRLQKRGREEGYDLLGEIENDSAKVLCLISQIPAHLQPLFRVCLSHALTKKLRLRFVGIGNGRFTFDVAKTSVLEMFAQKAYQSLAVCETFAWLKCCGVNFGKVEVFRDTASNISSICGNGSVDLVVTSPPYIPASSGREHYARARAIPLILTGAATLEELDTIDGQFVGEMATNLNLSEDIVDMPEKVLETLLFLKGDIQRQPKYLPTLQYYRDIRSVLGNVKKSLSENGRALFIVADSHTFYIHKTKKVIHTVDATKALCEIGVQAGLEVEEVINVPLKKSGGPNARPRSTDEYAESVIVFRHPH